MRSGIVSSVNHKADIDMKILIDNGHGKDTPGKRSPDGKLREYKYTREIAKEIVDKLLSAGFDAQLLVPEEDDISLKERVKRVNKACSDLGKENVLLISIHVNAFKDGNEWQSPRGWSCYTTKGKTLSDQLATILYEEAVTILAGHRIRMEMSDGDADWEEDFYILKKTLCTAVLTENFFMDNKEDVAFLLSDNGRNAIVRTHVNSIKKYIDKRKLL